MGHMMRRGGRAHHTAPRAAWTWIWDSHHKPHSANVPATTHVWQHISRSDALHCSAAQRGQWIDEMAGRRASGQTPAASYGMDRNRVRPPRDEHAALLGRRGHAETPPAVNLYKTILRVCHRWLRVLAVGKGPGFRFRASSLCSMQ